MSSRLFWLALALLANVFPALAQPAAKIELATGDGAEFVFVTAGTRVVAIPKTLKFGSAGQPGASFILQRAPSIGGSTSYVLNVTVTYSFDTAKPKLDMASKGIDLTGKTLTTVPTVRYTTYAFFWSAKDSTFSRKVIDQGTTNISGSSVAAFSIDFADKSGVTSFFQHPQPLTITVDLQPDIAANVIKDTSQIDSIVSSYFGQGVIPDVLPVTSIFNKLVEEYGNSILLDEGYAAAAITRELSRYRVQMDQTGRPGFAADSAARLTPPTRPNSVQQVRLQDRLLAASPLNPCNASNQLLLIDIGKTGCGALKDLLEAR